MGVSDQPQILSLQNKSNNVRRPQKPGNPLEAATPHELGRSNVGPVHLSRDVLFYVLFNRLF